MIPGGKVEFEYEWERRKTAEPLTVDVPIIEGDEYDTYMLTVTATVSDFFDAVMYMSNGDPGYPPEGGEVEDVEVTFANGAKVTGIPDDLMDKLVERATEEHYQNG